MQNEIVDRGEAMQTRSFSGIVFLAGIWLIISPFILGYNSAGVTWDQVIFGIIIAILGIIRYSALSAVWASWLSALAGLWMVIAPFAISGASGAARWSSVIAGLVTLILSLAITNSPAETPNMHRTHPVM
jgi:hypothetical protein